MIVPLSALLARGRRRHQPVPFFTVATPEIIEAVCRQVSHKDQKAVLVIEATLSPACSPAVLVAVAKTCAAAAVGQVSVMVAPKPTELSVREALTWGAPALLISSPSDTVRAPARQLTHWAVRTAATHDCEVVGVMNGLVSVAKLSAFVQETGVQAVALSIGVAPDNKPVLSLAHIKELSQAAKIPLISEYLPLTSSLREQAVRAGVTGFRYTPELLAEAFTAGVRTGLRNRSQYQPNYYLGIGMQAVGQAIRPFLVHP